MMSRRDRVAHVGVLVLTTLGIVACGDTDATDSSSATTESIESTDTQSDQIDLEAILLRAEDLPEGWTEVSGGSEGGDSCLDGLFGADRPLDPQFAETATFGASSNGPFLVAWVVAEPTSDVLSEVNDVVVACDGTSAPSGFTTTIDPTPVPGLPDDSLSVHGADVNADGSRIDFTLAGAGGDNATVVVFAATPLGEIDDAIVASAVNAMVQRIPPS